MRLRKSLVALAVMLAAGAIGTTVAASAMTIRINGDPTNGTNAVDGVFVSGTISIGSTYSCTSGNVAGIAGRGTNPTPAGINLTTLNLGCNTPLGNGTISLNSCTVPVLFTVTLAGLPITDLVVDPWVPGTANFGTGTCVKLTALNGFCVANIQGDVVADFDETVRTVGGVNYQDLVLHGVVRLVNLSGCIGMVSGSITLNNLSFRLEKTGGTVQGLDFGA